MLNEPAWSPEKKLRIAQATQALFTSDLGQEVLESLEEEFFERTSFNPDVAKMAFAEGQRHVVLAIRHRLRTDFSTLVPLHEEDVNE